MSDRSRREYQAVVDLDPAPINLLDPPSWRLLLALAARRWGVTEAAILSASRDQLVVAARHHAMWLVRTHTRSSITRIGKLFGRDHTTVLWALEAHVERAAGRRPKPYAWSRAGVTQFRRLLLAGRSSTQARRELGMLEGDLMRCPDYHGLMREAMQLSRNRAMQRALQLRQARA